MSSRPKFEPQDVPVGSIVTFQFTGKVIGPAHDSANPNLGKYVNVTDGSGTCRLAYLSEIVKVDKPLPLRPESGVVLIGNEIAELMPDSESWNSASLYFYNWRELLEYARKHNLTVREVSVGKEIGLG